MRDPFCGAPRLRLDEDPVYPSDERTTFEEDIDNFYHDMYQTKECKECLEEITVRGAAPRAHWSHASESGNLGPIV